MRTAKYLVAVLSVGCLILVYLTVSELFFGNTTTKDAETTKPSTTEVFVTTTTVPQTALCLSIQRSQSVAISRGGATEEEILYGLSAVMIDYLASLKEVAKEASASGIAASEVDFVEGAVDKASSLLSGTTVTDGQRIKAIVVESGLSVESMALNSPTLYAIASSACKADLGLRVQ